MEEDKSNLTDKELDMFMLNRFLKYQEESEKRVFYSNQRLDVLIYGICVAVIAFNVNLLLADIDKCSFSTITKVLLTTSSFFGLISLGTNLMSQITGQQINELSSKIADKEIVGVLGDDIEDEVESLLKEQKPKSTLNDRLNFCALYCSIFAVGLVVLAVSLLVFL